MLKNVCVCGLIIFIFLGESFHLKAQPKDQWWLGSSFSDSVKTFKWHASAAYSLSRTRGVMSGNTNNGDVLFVIRKGRITNYSNYEIDMSLKSSVNLSYAVKDQYVVDYIDYDISKLMFFQSGFMWERNDAFLLKNRYSVYGGLGFTPIIFKTLKLKSLFAIGNINQQYTIPVDNLNVIKEPYYAFYCSHDFQYTFSTEVSVTGKVNYFTDINATNRYRYGLNLNLRLNLIKHVTLIASYNYKYDNEYVLLGLIPDNSSQNIGIELSL